MILMEHGEKKGHVPVGDIATNASFPDDKEAIKNLPRCLLRVACQHQSQDGGEDASPPYNAMD